MNPLIKTKNNNQTKKGSVLTTTPTNTTWRETVRISRFFFHFVTRESRNLYKCIVWFIIFYACSCAVTDFFGNIFIFSCVIKSVYFVNCPTGETIVFSFFVYVSNDIVCVSICVVKYYNMKIDARLSLSLFLSHSPPNCGETVIYFWRATFCITNI